jgi:class 3 adenylate cyclase
VGWPSGTVTFLITDIEGSTRLWDQHRDEMRAALEAHDAIIRDAVAGEGGYVFATGGDGFCVAFQRASAALNAVLALRKGLDNHPWPESVPLKVRMSLHSGEAVERDGDYYATAPLVSHHWERLPPSSRARRRPAPEWTVNLGVQLA